MKDAKGHGSNKRGTHSVGIASLPQKVNVHPKVLEQIRKNPGGFSLAPATAASPAAGYMVSLQGRGQQVHESDLSGPNGPRIVSQFVAKNADVLQQPGAHIGGWTDTKTGITHLDVSHNVPTRAKAVALGKAHNQIAIWDVKRGKEIRTGGTGT